MAHTDTTSGGTDVGGEGRDLAQVVGALAHDLRNPLASLTGCAQTLQDRGDSLDDATRAALLEVVTVQAARLDWMVRAAAAYADPGPTPAEPVSLDLVLAQVAETCGVGVPDGSRVVVAAGARRLTIALEALVLAFDGAAPRLAVRRRPPRVELHCGERDLRGGGRRWKLEIADRLVREDGGTLEVTESADGVVVTVRLVPASSGTAS